MRRRDIDDRVLGRVEDLANLTGPVFPRVGAPEVIDPQESAFEEVSRSRAASTSLMPMVPTSDAMIIGHWNNASSVSLTTQG